MADVTPPKEVPTVRAANAVGYRPNRTMESGSAARSSRNDHPDAVGGRVA